MLLINFSWAKCPAIRASTFFSQSANFCVAQTPSTGQGAQPWIWLAATSVGILLAIAVLVLMKRKKDRSCKRSQLEEAYENEADISGMATASTELQRRHSQDDFQKTSPIDESSMQAMHNLFSNEEVRLSLEKSCKLIGAAAAVIDCEGKIIFSCYWQHACEQTQCECKGSGCCRSEEYVSTHKLADGGSYDLYRCRRGLLNARFPVITNGIHVADIQYGQFMLEDMPHGTAAKQQLNPVEKKINKALVYKCSYEKLQNNISFLRSVANSFGALTYGQRKAQESAQNLEEKRLEAVGVAEAAERAKLKLTEYQNQLIDLVEKQTTEVGRKDRMFHEVFNQSAQLLTLLSPDGAIFDVNRQACLLAGSEREQLIGMNFWEAPWAQQSEQLANWLQNAVESAADGNVANYETSQPSSDGINRILEASIVPMYDETQNITFLLSIATDVTEVRAIARATKANEARLKSILHSVQAGIVIVDPETYEIVQINAAALQMLQLTEQQVLGRQCSTLFSSEVECPCKKGAQNFSNEKCLLTRQDGTTLPIMKTLTRITLDEREFFLESFVDLSKQQEQERQIALSQQRLQAVLDHAPIIMMLVDSNGAVLQSNIASDNKLSSDRALIGEALNCRIAIKGGPCGANKECSTCIIRNATTETFETGCDVSRREMKLHTIRNGNEKDVYLNTSTTLLTQGDGSSTVLLSLDDVTEQHMNARRMKESRKKLAESEERSRLLLAAAGEGIFGISYEGGLEFINPAACDMLGYNADEVLGKDAHALFHHSYENGSVYLDSECPITKTSRSGKPSDVGNEVLWRKDGSCFPVHYKSMPVKRGELNIRTVVTFNDITSRRASELMLKRANRFQQQMSEASTHMLAGKSVETDAVDTALSCLLHGINASRAFIFETCDDKNGKLCMHYSTEICSVGTQHALNNQEMRVLDFDNLAPQWLESRSRGAYVQESSANFSDAIKEMFAPLGTRTLIAVPLEVSGQWSGYLGFCDNDDSRVWHFDEIQMLTTAAVMFGNYLSGIRSEDALRESRTRLQTILETTNEGFWMIDKDRKTLQANAAMCNIFGRDLNDVLGRDIYDFVDETNAQIFRDQQQARLDGQRGCYEVELKRKDGTLVPCLVNATPLESLDLQDNALSFAMVANISEQKASMCKLERSKNRLEAMTRISEIQIEDLNDFFATALNELLSLTESSLGCLMLRSEKNDAFILCAKSSQDQMDVSFFPDLRPTHAYQLEELPFWAEGARSGKPILNNKGCATHAMPEGGLQTRWMSIPIVESGEVVALASVAGSVDDYSADMIQQVVLVTHGILDAAQNYTYRQQLISAKDDAENANKAKSEFLANMSHEIRTPLNAVLGMGYLLNNTELTDTQKNYVQKMQTSAKFLLGTINDILDFSKGEAGAITLENTEFSLTGVLRDISDVNAGMAQRKGLELLFKSSHLSEGLSLEGDALRLSQVLNNLIANAVKFTKEGSIVLTTKLLSQSNGIAEIQFSITDTGIGLTEDKQKHLFGAFTQADASTTRCFGGTGLGLAISKKLVNLMGGEIAVKSAPGKGSTFFFNAFFKLLSKKETQHKMIKELNTRQVLIISGTVELREILRDMFEPHVADLHFANSCDEAELLIKESGVDFELIILDCYLPQLQKSRFCDKIKTYSPQSISLLLVPHESTCFDKLSQLCDGNVVKPFSQSDLFDAISYAFGADRMIPESNGKKVGKEQIKRTLQGAHVLLVEDNVINQEVAMALLKEVGISSICANDGIQALNILKSQLFDLVLMDVQMPVMDGYETTRKIRSQSKFADLPVIAMTANVMSGDREKALESGMNDHVGKPIDPDELHKVLAKWIKRSVEVDQMPLSELSEDSKPSESKVPFAFRAVDGIDTTAGLRYTSGNEALYDKILKKFLNNQTNVVADIREILSKKDYKAAERTAHSFKSVAGTIGAVQLQKMAATLEADIRENPGMDIDPQLVQIEAFLVPLALSISQAFEALNNEASTVEIEANIDVSALFEELRQKLQDGDASALQTYDQLKSGFHEPIFEKVRIKIESYAFEEALQILNTIDFDD